MKIFFRTLFAALVAALGGGCHGNGVTGLQPDYLATPVTATFNACPTKDDTGATVADVFPVVQTITVQNRGKAQGSLGLTLSGAGASSFTLGTAPSTLGALESVDIPVSFTTDHRGAVSAVLTVDDGVSGTTNPTVTLNGVGVDLPAQPTLQTGPQQADGGYSVCEDGATLEQCSLSFPDTAYGQSSTLVLKLRNVGCPTLKITGLSISSSRGNTQGFTIDTPAQLPSPSAPMLLSSAGGTQELTVIVRFTPTDDDSGNTDRLAYLSITSNDPASGEGSAPPARIGLLGIGVKPSIGASPGACDFSIASDPCGFATAQSTHDTAHFSIINDGNETVLLNHVAFASSGTTTSTDGRFTVTQDVTGKTLAPTQSAVLEVKHTDAPLFVGDTLRVTATVANQPVGAVELQVWGGKKPCLSTDPPNQVDFGNPTTSLTTRDIKLQNGAGCGVLTLSQVSVDASPLYSLVGPVPANTSVMPGSFVTATVQYQKPISGGLQLGALRIQSNDGSYAAPQGKVVQLYSEAPLDLVPVASLTACMPSDLGADPECARGATANFSASLASLVPAQLTVSGAASTDDGAVKHYRFTLLAPFPNGVTSAVLANNGTIISSDKTVLTIPSAGVYRVGLEVWDDKGQQSVNVAAMNLYVTP